jgi:hypothetical protein
MVEAKKLQDQHGLVTDFLQKVPIPRSNGKNIVTDEGFDSPFFRYRFFEYFERRGLGGRDYYVIGRDTTKGVPLASLGGHLGRVEGKEFSEILTGTLYYGRSNILWDLQRTTLSYFEANDTLTGSSFHRQTMDAFDENRDGVIDYNDGGKKGVFHSFIRIGATGYHIAGTEPYGLLRGDFCASAQMLRNSRVQWNPYGHDFMDQLMLVFAVATAFNLSTMEIESPDSLFPSMTWGKGKWPSIQFASYMMTGILIYGARFPVKIGLRSLYGSAFQYADKTLNGAAYTGSRNLVTDRRAVSRYVEAVAQGTQPLNFVIYVPMKYGTMMGRSVPNVQETTDTAKVFTAHFDDDREVWE